ncbi:MAG: hypothetical protein JXP34_12750, partial [Planctomycetes bacterium]|nr:hypothetical protein [Planctomycetota bacterium]
AGVADAIRWCRRLSVTRVFIETFRNGYTADRVVLARARDRFRAEGFAVSGCVTTTEVGKRSTGWRIIPCYTDEATRKRHAEIFAYTASLFDEIMIDDFLFTDCTCEACAEARGDRSWAAYRCDLMLDLSRKETLAAARCANPNARVIIKYPQWYDLFHERGYDVARQTEAFDTIWVGTETRDPDSERWGRKAQYEAYFIMRWLGGIGGAKTGGGWFDPYGTSPATYVEQARQTVLAGAREMLLFCYGSLRQEENARDPEALRPEIPVLREIARTIRGLDPRGVLAVKPPSSAPAEGEAYLFDFIGMLGIPLVPAHALPAETTALLATSHLRADPGWKAFVERHLAAGRPVLASKAVLADVRGRGEGKVIPLEWQGDPRSLMDRPAEALSRIRAPLLEPIGYRFDAPGRVALYIFADRSGDRVWAIENFADAPAKVALARVAGAFPRTERLVLPPGAAPEVGVEGGRIEGEVPPRTLIVWRAPESEEAAVRPIPEKALSPDPGDAPSRRLIEEYYDSILRWGRVVADEVRPVPDRPGQLYLGLPGHVEDHVRPTAYAAMVLAFLAEFRAPGTSLRGLGDAGDGDEERAKDRAAAIGLLRYLTAGHASGEGTCLNGKPWGNQWQSAMWARAAGMGGWLAWPHADEGLRRDVVRMIAFEADRFVEQAPKSRVRDDTGAEENAWNASIVALACAMMPDHSRAGAWERAAKRYMYNTFSVSADARDDSPADDGRRVRDWVTTVNAHDDYTVENHRLVHVGYLKNAAAELQENAIHWLLAGRPVPRACRHHLPEVFRILVSCMAWDGAPVYFGGNDWKVVHTQATDVILYAMRHLLEGDACAAYLEDVALRRLRLQQRAEGGYYNVRRDPEYGGLCATRLIACCLAHGIVGRIRVPIAPEGFDRMASGVTRFEAGRAVIHRTPEKFASFTWAQKRLALALPRGEDRLTWPHFASYLGIIDGEDSSERRAALEDLEVGVESDGFRASGRLVRAKGKLAQDFLYVSPAGPRTVYVERLRPREGYRLQSRETGIIGLEYPVGGNARTLRGAFGAVTATGCGGEAATRLLRSDWLNIDDRVGYVIARTDGVPNVIRHHDLAGGEGRVPKLQEWLSLVGEDEPALPAGGSWACVVTFLAQPAGETAEWARRVRLVADGSRGTCRIGDETIAVEFPEG